MFLEMIYGTFIKNKDTFLVVAQLVTGSLLLSENNEEPKHQKSILMQQPIDSRIIYTILVP
jgi:hypothetical protein